MLMADGYSRFFDRYAPLLLAGLAMMGAYYGQTPLLALATTLLLTLLLTRAWSRHSLERVTYRRETGEDRAFPGDDLELVLRLTNDKLLPLPWVEVDDHVPPPIAPLAEGEEEKSGNGRVGLRLAGSLSWKEGVQWRYRLRCRRRGIYRLGPAVITSGDPFGFFPRTSSVAESGRVVVYPKLIPLERLGLPPVFPLGEARAERSIFEDPSRTLGIRDYRREDPFRRIHWKATARRQELQVKVHEPTTTLEVAIFLGVDTFGNTVTGGRGDGETRGGRYAEVGGAPPHSGEEPGVGSSGPTHHSSPEFEHAVSVTASLAHRLIQQGHPVGLYVNGGSLESAVVQQLPPGSSQEQLMTILELLAGVEPVPCLSSDLLLAETAPRLPWGSGVVVISGSLPEPLLAALHNLGRMGQKPVVLLAGKGPAPEEYPGVAIHRVTGDES